MTLQIYIHTLSRACARSFIFSLLCDFYRAPIIFEHVFRRCKRRSKGTLSDWLEREKDVMATDWNLNSTDWKHILKPTYEINKWFNAPEQKNSGAVVLKKIL